MTADVYLHRYKAKLCHKIVKHTCQLCGFISNWERTRINNHLRSVHGSMSLTEYVDNFQNTYQQFPEFAEKESYKWMNQCTFTCQICHSGKHFQTRSTLNLHLRKDHQMEISDYIKKHPNYISTLNKMTCKVCEKSLQWDKDTIKSHLECEHKMTPEAYVKEILHGDLNSILETISKKAKHTSEELASTSLMSKKSKRKGLRSSSDSITTNVAQTWARGCLYTCHMCKAYFAGLRSVSEHMKSVHKSSSTNDNCVTVNMHCCQLCSEKVTHDEIELKIHLDAIHDISISDYYNKFKVNLSMPKLTIPQPLSFPKAVKRKQELPNTARAAKRGRPKKAPIIKELKIEIKEQPMDIEDLE